MKTRAAVAWEAGKPLTIETVDLDGPKAGEVLVEIKATGICHTDEFTRSGADPEGLFPAILGHEGAGVVVDVGPGVTSLKKGDHVIPLYTPECRQCNMTTGRSNPPAVLVRAVRLAAALAVALAWAPGAALAQSPSALAPNLVEISPLLTTSGQPSAASLATLGERGYQAVVYLAPPTVSDAVRDEAVIVGRQGIVYVNIPIVFGRPTESDYETFAATLAALGKRKVLVHCQVNMRASTMVFLYRVLAEKRDPKLAYEAAARVWTPEGPWKQLMLDVLRKHGVAFDPY